MVKKLAIALMTMGALSTSAWAASNADDRASNLPYNDGWQSTDNGGSGFQPWVLTASGAGGRYIGATGVGQDPSFGLFAGGTGVGDSSSADRSFTGALSAGQTFTLQMGATGVAAGGDVGLNLLNGSVSVFTFHFVGGGSQWQLNDGGSDFGSGIPFASNTPINFSFTYNGGNSYSINISQGMNSFVGNGFTANSDISNITGFRFFSNQQGGGENLGFNNLQVIPEPSTYALLVGPTLLGAYMFIRRRRA